MEDDKSSAAAWLAGAGDWKTHPCSLCRHVQLTRASQLNDRTLA